jgi:large subunit ribosomal protein L7/L12
MSAIAEIVDKVKKLSVLELSQLVKELETTFGVSAAAPVMMGGGGGGGAAAAAPAAEVEEKTTWNVVIKDVGANKIQVIKAVRGLTNLGLKEAKDLVDKGAGAVIKEGASKEESAKIKTEMEAAGAQVELK